MLTTIAWIDPDVAILHPLVRPLEKAGFKLLLFSSERAVVDAIEQMRCAELILIDPLLPRFTLPGLDPYQSLGLLRDLRTTHRVTAPAIILTTTLPFGEAKELAVLGVIATVIKPVRPSRLKAEVDRAMASLA